MAGKAKKTASILAYGLLTVTTSLWVFWGTAEMYYEGWWGSWINRVVYLIPGVICVGFTLLALKSPKLGGWLLILGGSGFTLWWWGMAAVRHLLTWRRVLAQFPVSGLLVAIGILLLVADVQKPRFFLWKGLSLKYALCLGIPLLIFLAVNAFQLPRVLRRLDDGDRGERLIAGNGVSLVWAPKGPGWNGKRDDGLMPSWDDIAFYGVPPVGFGDKPSVQGRDATAEDLQVFGLCQYLSEDGSVLLAEPQDVWRMPSADEIVRSLVLHGENAGCSWQPGEAKADCKLAPDKETPLWAPDESPIYMWAADEYDGQSAYYVSYNGYVKVQPKSWGNPRHGFRCVRQP